MPHETHALKVIDAERTRRALPFAQLIPALREAFASGVQVPLRHHHAIPQSDGTSATLLLMPAWHESGGYLGVKIATVFPGNAQRQLPAVRSGALQESAVVGTLNQLCTGDIAGRRTNEEITVFKAVGTALSDIASAALVYRSVGDESP